MNYTSILQLKEAFEANSQEEYKDITKPHLKRRIKNITGTSYVSGVYLDTFILGSKTTQIKPLSERQPKTQCFDASDNVKFFYQPIWQVILKGNELAIKGKLKTKQIKY